MKLLSSALRPAVVVLLLAALCTHAQISFTVAPGGLGGWVADDVLNTSTPTVVYPGAGAGLNVNAFSYGRNVALWNSYELVPNLQVAFSVDSTNGGPGVGAGLGGTAVNAESLKPQNDAPADLYDARPQLFGYNSNIQLYDGDGSSALPVTLQEPYGTAFEDVDGLDMRAGTQPGGPIYFSIDIATVGGALPALENEIWLAPAAANYDSPLSAVLFANGPQLGLNPGSDIDALVVFDNGNGVLDVNVDVVLFSLQPGNTNGLNPSSVYLSQGNGVNGLWWSAFHV